MTPETSPSPISMIRAPASRTLAISSAWRGLSIAVAFVMLMLAARVYLGRFEQLFEDHTIFAGVTYTEAHVTLTGMLVVSIALGIGALLALVNAV